MYKARLDIQENLIMPTPKVKALLRTHLYSYYTKSDNNEMMVDGNNEDVNNNINNNFWVLRIQGKLMEVLNSQAGGFYRKFSFFFQKIQIKFDENNEEKYQDIEWVKPNAADTDGFEVKRPGTGEVKMKILFHLNFNAQEYKISEELASIIGVKQETRPKILNTLWHYIKINSLQDNENPNMILNNRELQKVFHCEKMDITSITSRLVDHIKQVDPIEIEYTVRPVDDWSENQRLYDILVSIDDPHFLDISNFLSNIENESILFPKSLFFQKNESQQKMEKNQQTKTEKFYHKISEYDREISDMIEKLKKHKYKYDFYEAFSKDPVKFVNNFLVQQNSLLKIMKDESSIIESRWDYNSAQYYRDYEVYLNPVNF